MTRREKVISVTAFLIIWFGAGYRFWYQPLTQQIQAVEQQIAAAESEVRSAASQPGLYADADYMAEPAEKSRFLNYEALQREQEKQIPKQRALPELLEQLVAWANETGVRLAGFRMEPEDLKTPENPEKTGNLDKHSNPENKEASFRVMPVQAQIEGRYAQVIAFLMKLEQAERLIRVEQLELSLNDRAESSRSISSPDLAVISFEGIYNPALQARISFSIYYRPD